MLGAGLGILAAMRSLSSLSLLVVGLLSSGSALAFGQDAKPKADEKPWHERVAKALRSEVDEVRERPTVQTAVKARIVRSSPEVYRTLLTRLPQSARWLEALELGSYTIEDRPEGRFYINDRAGASAIGERALNEAGLLCVLARGRLEVSLLPKIRGTGVILVRFPEVKTKRGPGAAKAGSALRCEAEVWFRVESKVLHGLSRPFQRMLARVLRSKLNALVASATELAERVTKDPVAVYRALERAKVPAADLKAYRRAFLTL